MKKIKDRFLLGAVCGLVGNMPKAIFMNAAIKKKYAQVDGFEKAAAMFIPAHSVVSPEGRILGVLADSTIAGFLGLVTIHGLSIFGSNKAVLKGVLSGQALWQGLYGVLGSMGATKIKSVSPKTAISEFISHTIYGATVAGLAVTLGDPSLFKTKPLSKVPLTQSQQKANLGEIRQDNRNNSSSEYREEFQ